MSSSVHVNYQSIKSQMSSAEFLMLNQEHIYELNLAKITKTLKNPKIMLKMGRFAQNKMRVDFERATEKLKKIAQIKAKYLAEDKVTTP